MFWGKGFIFVFESARLSKMELTQKRLWDRRFFRLGEKGIYMKIKTVVQDFEVSLRYEEIGLDTVVIRQKEQSLVMSVVFFFLVVTGRILLEALDYQMSTGEQVFASLVVIFVFVFLFLLWFDGRKKIVVMSGGTKSFYFLYDSPDEQTVRQFIEALQLRIKEKIVQQSLMFGDEEYSDSYRKSVLKNLLEREIVSEERYQALLREIEHPDDNKSTIGFGGN